MSKPKTAGEQLLETIVAGMESQGSFGPADVKNLFPALALLFEPDELSDAANNLVGQFMAALGVNSDSAPEDVEAAIAEHYRRNPVHPALLQLLEKFFATSASDGDTQRQARVKKVLGQDNAPHVPIEQKKDLWGGEGEG